MSYIRCLGSTALAVSMFLTEPSVGLAQMPGHVIARDGDPAPGMQGGVTFKGFNSVVINNLGATAFVGGLQGPGVTADNDTGLWAGAASSLGLAAREDASAPGALGDTRFAQFQFPSLNNLGQVEFFAHLRGSGVNAGNGYGTWAGLPGSIQLAYRNGDPLPGVNPAFNVSTGAFPVYSNTGQVAFTGIYDDPNLPGSQFGIWAGAPGVISAVAVPGQQAPGFAAGVEFRNALLPAINPSGQIAYAARVEGPGVTINNDAGIWLRSGGSSGVAVREGTAAPGTGSFVAFGDRFGEPAINASGAIAFANTLAGIPVNGDNERALYAGQPGSLSLIAREGGTAAGTSPGVVFDDFGDRPFIGGSGAVVAQVKLRGDGVTTDNDDGIWANPAGAFTQVARQGDAAPDTSAGFFTLGAPTANFHGQTAFSASLAGNGIDASNDSGIWAVDPFDRLVPIAREGQPLRLGPGDDRTISGLQLLAGSGGQDGRSSSFNAASQLAFSAAFLDGTSAAVVARVGGTARLSDIAPVLGAAAANGYGVGTPATAGDIISVLGDSGYIRFAGAAPAGETAQILLDFSGTEIGVQVALAEIAVGGDLYGYSFTHLAGGDFQAMLHVPSLGSVPQYFYWNILNIGGVDLQRVQFIPEPATLLLLVVAGPVLAHNRSRKEA